MRLLATKTGPRPALAILLLAALGACAKSECDRQADLAQAAQAQACQGKAATCWYCDCLLQGRQVAKTVVGTGVETACVEKAPATAQACEGKILDNAQACLNDEDACKAPLIEAASQACDATPR